MTAPMLEQVDLTLLPPPGAPPPVEAPDPTRALRERLTVSALLTVPVVVLSTVPAFQFTYWQWISLALAGPVVLWGAWPFHAASWTNLRRGTATMDALVSIGTLAALGWSLYALLWGTAGVAGMTHPFALTVAPTDAAGSIYLEVAAGVTVFILAGRCLEARSERRARQALLDLGAGDVAVQRLADRVSGVFVPVVIVLAVATLGFWLGAGAGATTAVTAAVAVLIIACPPGLATPTALLVGTAHGAQLGVLIKGPEVLVSARRVDTIVLDRTATLTTGVMALYGVHTVDGVAADDALRMAGTVEQCSEYPAGRAIAGAAQERCGPLPDVAEFDSHPGLGVRGVVSELVGDTVVAHAVLVGRPALLAEHGIEIPAELTAAQVRAETLGRTAVVVSWDGVARAVLDVGDTVRPSSAEAVRRLRGLGLTPMVLSGDNAAAARAVAAQVGIDTVLAEVRPEDKVSQVRRLQEAGKVVALIGDGVDDAAALAAADLGLAMVSGTDEASGLTVVRVDLLAAVDAIRLFRRTLAVIEGNLFWAFAYHIAALPLAAAGLLNPMIAGAAMAFSSTLVVSNSLRLRRFRGTP